LQNSNNKLAQLDNGLEKTGSVGKNNGGFNNYINANINHT